MLSAVELPKAGEGSSLRTGIAGSFSLLGAGSFASPRSSRILKYILYHMRRVTMLTDS